MSFDSRSHRSGSVNVSEQRRALLLPQEVKELGTEEALITYEGLRPIRCRKIRYYQERAFRERLMPPPPLPMRVEAHAHEAGVTAGAAPTTELESQGSSKAVSAGVLEEERTVTREATVADIDRIESLQLSDFATDFSIAAPEHDGRLSEAEMDQCLAVFMEKVR